MQRNSEIVREKRGNREKRSFFPGCDGNGEGSRFSRREKKRQASMGRLRYVLFCRNGEKAVDGGTGICYTITWYFTVLVWLSWQSSSLVMSRSPVRIRPQAPKKQHPTGCCFFAELTRSRSLSPLRGNPATSSKKQHPTGCCFRTAEKPVIASQCAPRSKCPWGTDWRGNPSHLRTGCHTRL